MYPALTNALLQFGTVGYILWVTVISCESIMNRAQSDMNGALLQFWKTRAQKFSPGQSDQGKYAFGMKGAGFS